MNKTVRTATIAALAAAAAGALAVWLVRDQMNRHQRELFSPNAFRRLAALGHMAREAPSVDNLTLLRDFVAWEPRKLLRNRARQIYQRMEQEAGSTGRGSGEGSL